MRTCAFNRPNGKHQKSGCTWINYFKPFLPNNNFYFLKVKKRIPKLPKEDLFSVNNDFEYIVPNSVYENFPIRPSLIDEHFKILNLIKYYYPKPWFWSKSFWISKDPFNYIDLTKKISDLEKQFLLSRSELDEFIEKYKFSIEIKNLFPIEKLYFDFIVMTFHAKKTIGGHTFSFLYAEGLFLVREQELKDFFMKIPVFVVDENGLK